MCEGYFTASGTGNVVRVHGIIKKEDYVDVLKDNVKKICYQSSFRLVLGLLLYIQVGPKPLKDTGVALQSPDLNHIENL